MAASKATQPTTRWEHRQPALRSRAQRAPGAPRLPLRRSLRTLRHIPIAAPCPRSHPQPSPRGATGQPSIDRFALAISRALGNGFVSFRAATPAQRGALPHGWAGSRRCPGAGAPRFLSSTPCRAKTAARRLHNLQVQSNRYI